MFAERLYARCVELGLNYLGDVHQIERGVEYAGRRRSGNAVKEFVMLLED